MSATNQPRPDPSATPAAAIRLPETIEAAKTALLGLGDLLTAGEWQRAAIVYAFTEAQQGRRNLDDKSPKLSISDFAALGIVGLKSRDSVRFYRKQWVDAVGLGLAKPARPGRVVVLPALEWQREVKLLVVGGKRPSLWHPPAPLSPPPDYDDRALEAADALYSCLQATTAGWHPAPKTWASLQRAVACASEITTPAADDLPRLEIVRNVA